MISTGYIAPKYLSICANRNNKYASNYTKSTCSKKEKEETSNISCAQINLHYSQSDTTNLRMSYPITS